MFQEFLIHIDLEDAPHFDLLNLSNASLCNVLLVIRFD